MLPTNSRSEAIIFRTNSYGSTVDGFVQELRRRSGREVVIIADETKGPILCPPDIVKLSADPGRLGLLVTNDMMWRCGDYILYEVLDKLPDTDFFWMIEPDIRIHTPDLREFFDGEPETASSDLITPWFVKASPEWLWFDLVKPFVPNVFNCMLQVSRFSRRAIKFLLDKRRALTATFQVDKLSQQLWPNDEGFIGSYLHDGGFRISTFNQHAPSYKTSGTMTFTRPTSLNWLHSRDLDRTIYHPVVEGQLFVKRAHAYLSEREKDGVSSNQLLKEFGSEFLHQVRIEGGDVALQLFVSKLRDAAQRNAQKVVQQAD